MIETARPRHLVNSIKIDLITSVIKNFDFGKMLTKFVVKKLITDQNHFRLTVNRNTYCTSTEDNATSYLYRKHLTMYSLRSKL
jgi:hypothetical protein